MKMRITVGKAVAALLLILGAMVFLYPFLWMLFTSFKLEKDVMTFPPSLIGRTFTLDGYAGIWTRVPFFRYFLNTAAFATGVTAVSLLLDTMAGYSFARLRFKGRNALFLMVLVTLMIPFQVIMVPLYYKVFKLGLLNTYLGLILPRATNAFGIFMMRQFFVSLPTGLEEAARIDGCSEFKIFRSIMLPLCKPAVISLAIFHFMYNWNDLLYPLVLVTGSEMYTLSSGLAMFMGTHVVEYALLMAGGVLTLLPIFIAYCGAQKYFIKGIAMTGMKG
jgi:multiple sugar transport system permease protein